MRTDSSRDGSRVDEREGGTGGAAPEKRDFWDKLAIVLQPVGGLLTAVAVAVLGFWTSSYLREREGRENALRERMQTSETNARLYSELISKREESESALRKDMFTSIINSFLGGGAANLEQKVLNLELLVYNFHESLNLKPLFLHLERQVRGTPQRAAYFERLDRVAEEVTKKQMLVIGEGGSSFDATADWKNLTFADGGGAEGAPFVARDLHADGLTRNFRVELLAVDKENEQIQLRVTVRSPQASENVSTEFWVGHFDFPMIDNVRLPHDQRFAVVLNNFDIGHGRADLTVAYFPGKYASLREKPYYDEVLQKLLASNQNIEAAAGTAPARPSETPPGGSSPK
ncbi:MAG TPA: hypothetical protein VH854_11340 [Thermoanaerobaculia bacterium]|nr:hypothetical protein [Thermoanaerobaculia bacterium]